MAQRKLTEIIILNAISEIVERGEQPTTTLIHDQVGNIGSFATINKVFHPWRDNHEQNVSDLPAEVLLPSELEESFTQLAKKIWTKATYISNNQLEKQREALAQIEQEIKQELADAIKIGEVSENARVDLQNQLDKQITLNDELAGKETLLEKENEILKKQNDDISKLKEQDTLNKGKIERLKEKLENLTLQLKETKISLSEASKNATLKDKELGSMEGRLSQMQIQIEEQKQAYNKLLEQSLKIQNKQ